MEAETACDLILVPADQTEDGDPLFIPCRSWFELPQAPAFLLKWVMKFSRAIRADAFFNKRIEGQNINYLQEAITAAEFGCLGEFGPDAKVALVPEGARFPDFTLWTGGKETQSEYEIVWADKKGRKIVPEYKEYYARKTAREHERKKRIAAGEADPGEYIEIVEWNIDAEKQQAREAIAWEVKMKANKGYPRSTKLVVRNNLGLLKPNEYYGITKQWHRNFGEIWILKTPFLCQVHPIIKEFGKPDEWI